MSIEEENKAVVLDAYELFNKIMRRDYEQINMKDLDTYLGFFAPDYMNITLLVTDPLRK